MPSATPVSLAARERLRDHQATAAKAVAAHGAAVARLDAAAASVAAAVAEVARVLGADVAAAVLELPKSEVRRMSKKSE